MDKTLSLINKLNELSKYGIIITTINFNKKDLNNNTTYLDDVRIEKIQYYKIIVVIKEKIKNKQLVICNIKLNKALKRSIQLLKKYHKEGE